MRLTFNAAHRTALAAIERAAEDLNLRQREVTSGRRVNAPSDDPTAAAAAVVERGEIATLDQYARAVESVEGRLTVADTVLSDIVNLLTAARTTAASVSGSLASVSQRGAAVAELESLRDALVSDFNTSYRGSYLFSGAAATVAPYTRNPDGTIAAYAGDARPVSIDVDRQTAVQVSLTGDEIARGSDPSDLFAVLGSLIAAVKAGDATGIETGQAGLDRAFDRAVSAQGRTGAGLRLVGDQRTRLDRLRAGHVARLSQQEDANMIESISGLNRAETAYRAAIGAVATGSRLSLLDLLK